MAIDDGPLPVADLDTAPFLAALRAGRIELQRCGACGRHRFPPMPSCPWCGAEHHSAAGVAGTGSVYSWVVVHRALTPAFAEEVPYVIATVELDEGCRMFGRLEAPGGGPPDDVVPGRRVTSRFVDHGQWTELRFVTLSAGEPAGEGDIQ